MPIYKIADMNLLFERDAQDSINRLEIFKTSHSNKIDIKFDLKKKLLIREPKGNVIVEEDIKWIKNPDNTFSILMYDEENRRKSIALLKESQDWENTSIMYKQGKNFGGYSAVEMLAGMAFRNRILHKDGIVVHASGLEYNGKGILFTAPSGTGKSTQARLWEKHMGAEVLNDDTPALRFIDDKLYMYGTPWSGSGTKYQNKKTELGAIVVIAQAKENQIEKVKTSDAVRMLFPRCFVPYQDAILMDKAANVIEKIIATTPIYFLRCRPDQEAVEVLKKCIEI